MHRSIFISIVACRLYIIPSYFQGTFSPYEGLNNTDQCTPCTPGDYCGAEGLNATSGLCTAGYYCPGGQNVSTPAAYPCTIGHYCPNGSVEPIPCANGTYMNHTLGEACYECPAGWYVHVALFFSHHLLYPQI